MGSLEERSGWDAGLKTKIAGLLLAMAFVLLAVFGTWTYAEQRKATEAELLETSRVLVDEMDAVWDFVSLNQERIDCTSDGTYEYKGLHCAIVGKSVAVLFSRESDYRMRFTKTDPRNISNAPDEVEAAALAYFERDPQASEYYCFDDEVGEQVFRYVSAMHITDQCTDCHGSPAGEIDVTGYPREGLARGDLAGAASVTIPTALYDSNMWLAVGTNLLFFLVIIAGMCVGFYIVLDRLVTRPVAELSSGLRRVGEASARPVCLKPPHAAYATSEISDLFIRFNEMAARIEALHAGLEGQVEERTEQLRRANEELRAQRLHVERVNERLKGENRYKSDFLAIVSHELRTPLTSVLAFAELLDDSLGSDEALARAQLEEIRKNGRVLLEMVDNVLETARIQAGSEHVNLEIVDVSDIIGLVESSTDAVAVKKGVSFSTSVDHDVPLIVSDWEKLRRIVSNLVSNAVKFTPSGGDVSVHVSFDVRKREVAIAVRDTGIGIPADKHRLVFERFTQENMSTVRRYGGSGLGLSLVDDLVSMLGGSIDLVSAPGFGSTFTVNLPIRAADADNDCAEGGGCDDENHVDR
ncbi:MAG: ATP-binding protein [Slackia sp.]|nr:ATP-binding protein [Slackia sp.]